MDKVAGDIFVTRSPAMWGLAVREQRKRAAIAAELQAELDGVRTAAAADRARLAGIVSGSRAASALLASETRAPNRRELARRARRIMAAKRSGAKAAPETRVVETSRPLTEFRVGEAYLEQQRDLWSGVRRRALDCGDAAAAANARNAMWVAWRNELINRAHSETPLLGGAPASETAAAFDRALWMVGVMAAGARQQRAALTLGEDATSPTDPRGLLGDPFAEPLSLDMANIVAAVIGSMPFLLLMVTFDLFACVALLMDIIVLLDEDWTRNEGREQCDAAASIVSSATLIAVEIAVHLGLSVDQVAAGDFGEDPREELEATLRRSQKQQQQQKRKGSDGLESFFLRCPPAGGQGGGRSFGRTWTVPPSGAWEVLVHEGWSLGPGLPPSISALRTRPDRAALPCASIDRYRLLCQSVTSAVGPSRVREAWRTLAQKRGAVFEFGLRLAERDATAGLFSPEVDDDAALASLFAPRP